MVVNPAGPQCIFDGANPRTVSAKCNVGTTGGCLVFLSGIASAVGSSLQDYVTSDIVVAGDASGAQFNGIVITPGTTASGNYVTVATQGTFIVTAAGTIIAGQKVGANGGHAVSDFTSGTATWSIVDLNRPIGRALIGGGSEAYVVVQIGV